MNDWMAGAGSSLFHTPDVVVLGMDAPGVWTCIEVKTLDVTARFHMDAHHTDRDRLTAHLAAIRTSRRADYRVHGPHAVPLPPHLRLRFLVMSSFGAISSSGHDLFAHLARLIGGRMPSDLAPAATWAAPRFAPLARMLVGFAARRGLAQYVRLYWRRAGRPPPPPPPSPPPPPQFAGLWYERRLYNHITPHTSDCRTDRRKYTYYISRNLAFFQTFAPCACHTRRMEPHENGRSAGRAATKTWPLACLQPRPTSWRRYSG